ncbi:photosystem II repair protein Psb32 [Spirulina sp. 06S082]|uniref:photosystem II repair protein Psb32 n=1 Tax=Spirulina sp. 06S082 TaxID=3110248 RepID=UPI002B1FE328|nr:TPM domain-containing protein [Spirulina sp. 06S082]MEA5469802.1 TPM domain-containing protein [Spirulina sp. 06S082]
MNRLLATFAPAKSTLNRLVLGLCTVFVLLAIAATPAIATTIYELPNISGQSPRAIDSANVLSPLNEGKLNKSLEDLATKTGKDVWLVTVRIGYGDTVEEFTDALFDRWFPTPEAGSDRVLLVLDTLSNNSAIRVGEGLQTLLPDDIAQSIAVETLLTPIRSGEKYNQAFLDARDRLSLVLSGEPDPGPPAIAQANIEGTFADAEETDDRNATVWVIGFLVVATIVPMLTYYLYVGFPGQ